MEDEPNAALSPCVSGIPGGIQLTAVFQSPLTGLRLQVNKGCGKSVSATVFDDDANSSNATPETGPTRAARSRERVDAAANTKRYFGTEDA